MADEGAVTERWSGLPGLIWLISGGMGRAKEAQAQRAAAQDAKKKQNVIDMLTLMQQHYGGQPMQSTGMTETQVAPQQAAPTTPTPTTPTTKPKPMPVQPSRGRQGALPIGRLPGTNPVNIGMNISKEGETSFSLTPNASFLDDQRRGAYLTAADQLAKGYEATGMPEAMARVEGYRRAAGALGYLPENFANLLQLSEQEKEESFNAIYQRIISDPITYKAIAGTGAFGEDMDKQVQTAVIRAISQDMGGYTPDWAKPAIFPISPELTGEVRNLLAARGLNEFTATASDISEVLDQKDDRQVDLSARESYGDFMAKAVADARKPISGEDRANWGISDPNIQTYADIAAAGERVLSFADKKAFTDILQAKMTVKRLKSYLSIFPVDSSPQRRTSAKALLVKEATMRPTDLSPDRLDPITKEPLWRVYLRFNRTRENTSIMFRQLAGENSSRFSDKDMQVALKQMPRSGLMPGNLLDDRGTAESSLDEVEKLLDERLSAILVGPVQTVPSLPQEGMENPPPRQPGETINDYMLRLQGGT